MDKNKVNKNINLEEKVKEILTRGVEEIFVAESLKEKLLSGKKLRIKLGIDPTSAHIHIGRAVVLRKLKAFQDLGHKIVFIVGDFTAVIGDPSDKLQKRPMLTKKDIENNLKTYKKQVGSIINLKKAEFHRNSGWLAKLKFQEICDLAEVFSVQQMISRRNFSERWEKGEEISLREFMYPLMQGYDSVKIEADIEIGGTDQLFNLKAGRIIQKHFGMREQDIMTLKMLPGTDGRKMSSSWGNIIAIDDDPKNMYGKVMALRDELIPEYFLLATDLPVLQVEEIKNSLKNPATNPKNLKMRLAREIVGIYHGEKLAIEAENSFISIFSEKQKPEDLKEILCDKEDLLSEVLVKEGIVKSKSEFGRLVKEGAISNIENNTEIKDIFEKINKGGTFKIGKHRFVKLKACS